MHELRHGWMTAGILSLLMVFPTRSYSERVPVPDGIFYYQPAASVFGAEATWINPAALTRYKDYSFQLMTDYYNGDYFKSFGSVVARDGLGIAYRDLNNPEGDDFKEYIIAAAFPAGKALSAGLSYWYFKEGPGIYNNRHLWNFGLNGHPQGAFAWGAVFSNLNRGRIEGERSEIDMRYSLAYRPRSVELTVAADMFLAAKTKLKNADFIYHVNYMPTPGFYVNASIDNDGAFELGMRTNLLQYFAGAKRGADDGGHHRGSTFFFGATSSRQPSMIAEQKRLLSLNLAGSPSENPRKLFFGQERESFLGILLDIYRAADDRSISEMSLSLGNLSIGFGQAQELRQALQYFHRQGKRIVCHMNYPDNIAYYVASVCDQVLIPPVSQVRLVGLRVEQTFYAGTLDKIGVKFDFMQIGPYKSGAEPFTRREASEENRSQMNRLMDDLFGQFVDGIAEGRGINADSVRVLIDEGPFTSKEALDAGLVDGLSYRDEVRKNFLSKLPEVSYKRYKVDTLENDSWRREPVLAIVVASGEVLPDGGGNSWTGGGSDVTPSRMRAAFRSALSDEEVKGVVFRIDSPGGVALTGDEIHHEADICADKKLMVVSMGNIATSGGYYIAMPAKSIFCNPATITGSIGIFGGKVDLSGLYKKIDLRKELYTRGRYAGMLSAISPFSDDEREKYYSHLEAMYDHFVELVAQNRQIEIDSVEQLGQGRVWTGREAVGSGLTDNLGGVKEALEYLSEKLALKDYRIRVLPEKRGLFDWPGRSLLSPLLASLGGTDEVESLLVFWTLHDEDFYMRLPYDIQIE